VTLRRSTRDRLADAAVTAVAAVLGGLVVLASLHDASRPGSIPWDLTIGGLACAALFWLRRRWPTGLALVLMAVGLLASSALGAVAMAVFTVAVHRPWRVTACMAALNMTVIVVTWQFVPVTAAEYRSGIITAGLVYAVLITTGLLIRSQRQLVRSLRERAKEEQRVRVEEARHLERERLAREMHDVLGHRISLLAVHAGALEFHAGASAEEARAARIIRQCAIEAMEDLREVVGVLRDEPGGADPTRPQPVLTDLTELIEQSRQAGTEVSLDHRGGELSAVPARIGRHAYRIVQEGLTNSRKHAPGTPVLVIVDGDPGRELSVEISNPLPPAGSAALFPTTAGAGLIGLRERVDLVGGRLEHGRTDDGLFRLRARLPWPR
jgi:signal transduction histidine kinase